MGRWTWERGITFEGELKGKKGKGGGGNESNGQWAMGNLGFDTSLGGCECVLSLFSGYASSTSLGLAFGPDGFESLFIIEKLYLD